MPMCCVPSSYLHIYPIPAGAGEQSKWIFDWIFPHMSQWRNAAEHIHTHTHPISYFIRNVENVSDAHSWLRVILRRQTKKLRTFAGVDDVFPKRHNSIFPSARCVRLRYDDDTCIHRNCSLAKWFNKFVGFENWYKLTASVSDLWRKYPPRTRSVHHLSTMSAQSGECIYWIPNLITFDPFGWASLHQCCRSPCTPLLARQSRCRP